MISTEQWRSCIGLFNVKPYSGQLRYRTRRCRNGSATLFTDQPSAKRFPSTNLLGLLAVCRTGYTILLVAVIFQQLILRSGDVESNPGPVASDRPKIHELITLKKADETKLEVTKWITSHELWKCVDFASMLLRDDVLVRRYQNDYKEKDEFVRAVLRDWLFRDDDDTTDSAVPRTWSALAECVSDAGLNGALAKAIRDTCPTPSSALDSVESPLVVYREYLKELYSAEYPDYTKLQFTASRPKHIVNLALVHKERDENDRSQQECLLYQLHGNIDLIQQKKTPITVDQIGILASGEIAQKILIEGAPGIGKTTFLWHLCHQWAVGKLLQQWELVILVQLRHRTSRTAQCISDLLYHPNDDVAKAVCRLVKQQEGKNVLMIFDGYDELSEDQCTESIVLNMLQHYPQLRKATVLVSSRPFATKSLPNQFKNSLDQHMEILGFTKEDIDIYLTAACQDNLGMLSDLKSYISSRPFISSVLYNPLHCTIVTELYLQYWQKGEKGFAPSTLTQLYEAFVLNLLRRHLNLDMTPSWKTLPSHVSHQLDQLAKFAARGIMKKQYIFDDVPGDTLGLMHSVVQIYNVRPGSHSISYSFGHLTLQEFLAARHWSNLPSEKLTELVQWRDLFPIEQYLSPHNRRINLITHSQSHWPVLLFLAGLTKFTEIPSTLMTDPFLSMEDILMPRPTLFQLLFESQSSQLVSTVFRRKRVESYPYRTKISLDWFAMGYCIAHSDATSQWSVMFDSFSTPPCIQAFLSGLHSATTNTHGSITKLSFVFSFARDSYLSQSLTYFPSLFPYAKNIEIFSILGGLYSDDNDVIANVFQKLSDYCPRLKRLELPEMHPPYLLSQVRFPRHIESLFITLPFMKDDSALVPELQQCLALKSLQLSAVNRDTNITTSLISISPLLAGQIECLYLWYFSINSDFVHVLAQSLTSSHSSVHKLVLNGCTISSSDYSQLITAIVSSKLTIFESMSIHIDASVAKGLATAIAHSKTLAVVDIYEDHLSNESAVVIAEAIRHSSLKILRVGHVEVSKDTFSRPYPLDTRLYID